jgi:hypothetical protein
VLYPSGECRWLRRRRKDARFRRHFPRISQISFGGPLKLPVYRFFSVVQPVMYNQPAVWVKVNPSGMDERGDELAPRSTPVQSCLDAAVRIPANVTFRCVFSREIPEELEVPQGRGAFDLEGLRSS